MAKSNIFLDSEDWTSWLASTGFLFPRNELELARYNKLYTDSDLIKLTDSTVSIKRILTGTSRLLPAGSLFEEKDIDQITSQYRMVARNGEGNIPDHIWNKMKNNQQNDDNGLPEKNDQ